MMHFRSPLDAAAAAELAQALYGLRATAHALPGEYDLNFHLHAEDGREYTLKIMHAGYQAELLDLQIQALEHLHGKLHELCLPQVQRTHTGELTAQIEVAGTPRLVWMLSYIPGELFALAKPRSPELLESLGEQLGRLDAALAGFNHPAAERALKWDLAHAGWIAEHLDAIDDASRRALVAGHVRRYESEVAPQLRGLTRQIIHNDANDYNVLINGKRAWPRQVVGLIDFGDMLLAPRICELAIAAAYAMLDAIPRTGAIYCTPTAAPTGTSMGSAADPLEAVIRVALGYHRTNPLTEEELALLFPLVCMRLAVSVVNSALRKREVPDDPYITISEAPAWDALERLERVHPRLAYYRLRAACGLPPLLHGEQVRDWLRSQDVAAVVRADVQRALVFDLGVSSLMLGANPANADRDVLSEQLVRAMAAAGAELGVGRYGEARLIYTAPAFATGAHPTDERRTIHLGIDLFAPAGTPLFAPLAGEVAILANNTARLDYGPLIVLRHQTDDGTPFWTLYGHLSAESLELWQVGQPVAQGAQLAMIGAPPVNGDWPPHLHFQIILDLLELDHDFPGVALASQRAVWEALSPDPNVILRIPAERFPQAEPTREQTLAERRARIGRNLSISYRTPLKIVRGWKQYLYDETGRAYLDVYNNVPHVGHSHPRVVEAAQRQLALLNTNTRYLHDNIVRYAERLTATLPPPLSVCFFVNSASEANELALRLARAATGAEDMIVLDAAYHGHTTGLIDISPYKFNGPGGTGPRPWVHIAPIPDDYRGPYKRNDPQAGPKYARHVAEIAERLQAAGTGLAGFIAESLPSVGGQIVLPPGYLPEVYRAVRAAGGLCIADEVQVGFGRLGTHFWGFQMQDVVPDIVVMGKPIGNAFPLGAVVTTPAIADAFNNGMEFFSTFGGNPVSCAVGLAVLDVIHDEQLQAHALRVGGKLLDGLKELVARHPIVGDARGSGLFLGLEFVRDRTTLEPADTEASYVVNRLRDYGILAGTDGPYHNVIKLRPPMPFDDADAAFLLATLDTVLREDFLE